MNEKLYVYCHECEKLIGICFDFDIANAIASTYFSKTGHAHTIGSAEYFKNAHPEVAKNIEEIEFDVITATIDIEDEDTILREYPELNEDADFQKMASDIYKNDFEKIDDWENKEIFVTFQNKGKAIWGFRNGDLEFYPCDCGRGLIFGSDHMCSCCWDENY